MALRPNLSKKKKFVADGVFYCELNEFLRRELGEDGYSGLQVRVTPQQTEVIIYATRVVDVLGEEECRIRQLTSMVQKRFRFPDGGVQLFADRIQHRGLSPVAQVESLRFKLVRGLPVRRACYGVMRFVMDQ
eukprot:Rhum_TRINITY_DN10076_c0_g2::Rhum_TRINITY_DN10076_c0_g2_i1::g.36669::m.36669/K02985/RP-S3e, RPS3; small subunit ribosomal protein S3e